MSEGLTLKYSEALHLVGFHAQEAAPFAEDHDHENLKFKEHLERMIELTEAIHQSIKETP